MPTKAEIYRAAQARSGPKKARRVRRPRRKATQTPRALLSESPGERHIGEGFLNRRDRSKSAARLFHPRARRKNTSRE
jgi:hypothetical protein